MGTNPKNTPTTETQNLIWALLDEQISESDFQRLESMIREDEQVRQLYVQCVQIHVDLQQWFAEDPPSASGRALGAPLDLPQLNGDSSVVDPAV